jgi:hypothetical protein
MKNILIIIAALVLIAAIWIIKSKTSYIYYHFAFEPERNVPQKVAWLLTILISLTSALFIW